MSRLSTSSRSSGRALEHLRVLEVGDFIAAPFCGKLLADLGAQVVKIEPAGRLEEARTFGPFPDGVPDPESSGLFCYLNGGKLGVTLDLACASGRKLLHSLASVSDILLIEEHRLGERGLDLEALRGKCPQLITVRLTPFGESGPYKDYRGYELNCWHGSAAGHRFLGFPEREPVRTATYLGDYFAGIHAAAAAMVALAARRRTGRGQHVEVSKQEAMALMVCAYGTVSVYFDRGQTSKRGGYIFQGGAPWAMLPCKDGYVSLNVIERHQWEGLVRAMGNPAWANEPMFQGSFEERRRYGEELYALIADWLGSRSKEELFRLCQGQQVPATPVYNVAELLRSEHLRQRDYFVTVPVGPRSAEVPGAPYRLSKTPWRAPSPAPRVGEHNRAVYCDILGLPARELAQLARAGVI